MGEQRTVAEHVGANVRDLRRAAGLTQAELAAAMSAIGLRWHRGLVSDIESGARMLTIEELVALATYFEIPVRALATRISLYPTPGPTVLGSTRIQPGDWFALWDESSDHQERRSPKIQKAIDRIVGKLRRPWARIWRTEGGNAAAAYQKAWEEITATRPLPGPTFVPTKGPVTRGSVKPPWGQPVVVELEEGVPFVAHDEVEREELEELERLGLVRRVSPQTAYKLRQRKKRGK